MKRYTILIKIVLIVILSLTIAFLILKSLYFTSVMMSAILIVLAFSLYLDQRKTIRRMDCEYSLRRPESVFSGSYFRRGGSRVDSFDE